MSAVPARTVQALAESVRLQLGTDVLVLITPGPPSCAIVVSAASAEPSQAAGAVAALDRDAPEADEHAAAVAAYRLSVQAGNPLSERGLALAFGRTSRRWARGIIADARREEGAGA